MVKGAENSGAIGGSVQVRNAYSQDALRRCVKASDARDFGVDLKADREAIVASAISAASLDPSPLSSPQPLPMGKNRAFFYSDYPTNLLVRATTRYIAQRFRITVPNRDRVVKSVIEAMSDGSPFHVIRRDITSFYENIPTTAVRERLLFDTAIPKQVRRHLRAYFSLVGNENKGLARGIGLSTILAEFAMEGFDKAVREIAGVYRYFRYSDDILVFCTGDHAHVGREIDKLIPSTMTFNASKCLERSFDQSQDKDAIRSFDYLGYKFSAPVNSPRKNRPRLCNVSIADKKIKKLKTRIVLSMKHYSPSEQHLLLYRLRYLSGNHKVVRVPGYFELKGNFTRSGIYFNYKRCGLHEGSNHTNTTRSELKELDWFYHNLLTSPSSRYSSIIQSLPPALAEQIRNISFERGYSMRLQARVPSGMAGRVKAAWRHH